MGHPPWLALLAEWSTHPRLPPQALQQVRVALGEQRAANFADGDRDEETGSSMRNFILQRVAQSTGTGSGGNTPEP